jgi:peptidoglycan/LPS O-acetylase OafA/YrhL
MANSRHRNEVIDGFRAISIFMVLLYHYLVRWAPPLHKFDFYGYHYTYSPLFELGQFGVHIFFVISGLVIAMTLVKSQSPLDFAVRRFARLYPAYITAATLLTIIVFASGGPFTLTLKDYLATLTMAAPQLGAKYVDNAYWSLFVEVKFYAISALLFLIFRNRFWMGVIAMAFIGQGLRPFSPKLSELIFMAHFLPLFLIGMAGWYYIFNAQCKVAAALLFTGLVCYALNAQMMVSEVSEPDLRLLAHVVILGGAFAMLLTLRFWRTARFGPLAYIGRASYSWYLVHQTIGVIIIGLLVGQYGWPDMAGFTAALAASLAIACLMFERVELPAQRLVLRAWHHGRAHVLGQPKTAHDGA